MSTVAGIETAMIVHVEQIVVGGTECYCGEDAVLVVTTEPDDDPGPVCYTHAAEYIALTTGLIDRLFGPKEA